MAKEKEIIDEETQKDKEFLEEYEKLVKKYNRRVFPSVGLQIQRLQIPKEGAEIKESTDKKSQ